MASSGDHRPLDSFPCKRGNRYLRKLLVHGARACFRHPDRTRDRLGSWLDVLQAYAPEQSCCRTCRRDGAHCLGCPDQAGSAL
nr:IS110 family transposase [Mesorhizobium sp. WSM3862]